MYTCSRRSVSHSVCWFTKPSSAYYRGILNGNQFCKINEKAVIV